MVSSSAVDRLRRRLSSAAGVFTPGSRGYDTRRQVVNRRFDRKPAVIVRCASARDAAATIRFAREHGLQLSIRSGGCSPAGFSSNDGGVMLDVSLLAAIRLDEKTMRARVGPGLLLEKLYARMATTDFMIVTGECKPVGISGVTLGGGFSLLSRSLGLACDNLLRATVVTADGAIRSASAEEEPDLFWALRGGGCNYGVVTSLDFRIHRLRPKLLCATVMWQLDAAADVLTEALAYFNAEAPDELNAVFAFAPLPSAPNGKALVMVAVYNGSPAAGRKAMDRLTSLATPLQRAVLPQSYAELIAADFPAPVEGVHDYFKSGFVTGATPRPAIELLVERFRNTPQLGSKLQNMIFFELAGGAINSVAPEATAFVHRRHSALVSLCATWQGATGVEDPAEKRWADALHTDMAPYFSGAVYQNYPDAELTGWARAYYGQNLERLSALKRHYDPDNVFRFAQSIPVG